MRTIDGIAASPRIWLATWLDDDRCVVEKHMLDEHSRARLLNSHDLITCIGGATSLQIMQVAGPPSSDAPHGGVDVFDLFEHEG